MNDWIVCIILSVIGIVMLIIGICLDIQWNKRINSWKSLPSLEEHFSSLSEAWRSFVCVAIGVVLLLISVIVAIFLII